MDLFILLTNCQGWPIRKTGDFTPISSSTLHIKGGDLSHYFIISTSLISLSSLDWVRRLGQPSLTRAKEGRLDCVDQR